MKEYNIGDLISMRWGDKPYFSKGDFAILSYTDGTLWWADFNNLENDEVYRDGIWCVSGRGDFEVILPVEI